MTFTESKETEKMKSSKKLKSLGTVGAAMMLIVLTSCGSGSLPSGSNLNIYQPSTLRLKKNSPIQTKDGIYTPQKDEVWHSDARYRKLEREVYYLPRHQILADK
jgi:hypothetical protein